MSLFPPSLFRTHNNNQHPQGPQDGTRSRTTTARRKQSPNRHSPPSQTLQKTPTPLKKKQTENVATQVPPKHRDGTDPKASEQDEIRRLRAELDVTRTDLTQTAVHSYSRPTLPFPPSRTQTQTKQNELREQVTQKDEEIERLKEEARVELCVTVLYHVVSSLALMLGSPRPQTVAIEPW